MNSLERMRHRLRGDPVDRPPNFDIMMTFAAETIGQPLARYYLDHRVLCEANMAMLERFDLDIVQAISDPYREAADLGAEVTFPEDGLPTLATPPLQAPEDLATLMPTPTPYEGRRMSDRLAAITWFREQVGEEVPIMGWVEGALAEAADLRGVGTLLMDLYDRSSFVRDLIELCVEVEIAFAKAQIEAGADMIGLGDAIASQISPVMYREYALPYERRIFQAVHEMGGLTRLHICGDTTQILEDMVVTEADIIDIDWMVDMARASHVFGGGPSVCGNFDPVQVMLEGTPEEVYRATQRCVAAGGNRSISAAGCEIPRGTPHENLRAQSRALRGLDAERSSLLSRP